MYSLSLSEKEFEMLLVYLNAAKAHICNCSCDPTDCIKFQKTLTTRAVRVSEENISIS
jgi:hypothetical protein